MKCKHLLLIILVANSLCGYAQTYYNQQENFVKANSIWVFGSNAGVDFNTASPAGIKTKIFVGEGSASVADPETGQLLFYSDGRKCWNRNDQVMPNGDSILGNKGSTTQGVCIVPVIDSPGKYYLFSLSGPSDYAAGSPLPMLAYSKVDMRLDNGMGDIITGQKNIVLSNDPSRPLSESMIAIPGNNCDIWLLVHENSEPVFRAYHITTAGLDTVPVMSTVVTPMQGGFPAYQIGAMAVSPDRSMVAIGSCAAGITVPPFTGAVLARFNATTGSLSDPVQLNYNAIYGVCFSPDNSKLYVNGRFYNTNPGPVVFNHKICQYDVSVYDSATITSSATIIDSNTQRTFFGYLKLYGDKIYCLYKPNGLAGLSAGGSLGLSCIQAPNLPGASCNYDSGKVVSFYPGIKANISLPNDVVYPLDPDTSGQTVLDTAVCGGTAVALKGSAGFAGYLWDDGSAHPDRVVSQSGTYWVLNKDRCHPRVDTFVVQVYDFMVPVITVDGFVLSTTTPYQSYQWLLNGAVIPGATQNRYSVLENGDYQVIVRSADGCTDTSDIYEVNNASITAPKGLQDQVILYPNPAADLISIQTSVAVNVVLCSIEGKMLKYIAKAGQVPLSDVAEGIYLLKIYDRQNRLIKTEKIFKAR